MHYSPLGESGFLNYPDERIVWEGLSQRWPQLNRSTKIVFTQHRQIYMEEMPDIQYAALPMREKHVWKRGAAGYMYRVLGALFNEPEWTRRYGETIEYEPDPVMPRTSRREIRLEAFMYTQYSSYEPRRVVCAYDAPTDTLFIRK